MAKIEGHHVNGDLFAETDRLALAEEIYDLGADRRMASKQGQELADRLVMLDIAYSLRRIAGGQALHTTRRTKY